MPKLTEEERHELAKKLDKDADAMLQDTIKKAEERRKNNPQPEEEEEDIDALAERLKRHPAFMTEFDPSQPMSPEMEGMMALKYSSDDADDNAQSYKEEGNIQFKAKKFRWAIDNYTAGIKEMSPVKLTNAILYSNRAAANAHIGNNGSAIKDCILARKFVPDHMKAIVKGMDCYMKLAKYDKVIEWCDEGLLIEKSHAVLLEKRAAAVSLKKKKERDERKVRAEERRIQKQEEELLAVIKSRGVTLDGSITLSTLEPTAAAGRCSRVHLDSDSVLHWPVMFLYPEHGETDFISAFSENSCFRDHLAAMFQDVEPAAWDTDHKYKHNDIQLYYEQPEKEKLIRVPQTSTLKDVLAEKSYKIRGGTPGFIVLVKDSTFAKQFLAQYNT